MSAVLHIDNVPHIVRYGMSDDKAGSEKCWIQFYRSGIRFDIYVTGVAIEGTDFAKKWVPLLKAPIGDPVTAGPLSFRTRWETLCTFVITECLGTIREVVRGADGDEDHELWGMLEGYLKTMSYELEVVKNDSSTCRNAEGEDDNDGVYVRLREGPIEKPSYEHWPLPAESIRDLPDLDSTKYGLNMYHARDLEVLDADEDWKCPPTKLRTLDGQIFTFVSCERNATRMPQNIETNSSLDTINAYCRLFTASNDAEVNMRQLRGVVITDINKNFPAEDAQVQKDMERITPATADDAKIGVAGILLDYLPSAVSLGDFLERKKENAEVVTTLAMQHWKEQITQAVELLHSHRITIGGHNISDDDPDENSTWYYINQHTIELVISARTDQEPDSDNAVPREDAWLTLKAGCTHHLGDDEAAFQENMSLDRKGVEKAFTYDS